MNNSTDIPSELNLVRNQLIDIAFGRSTDFPKDEDIEELVYCLERGNDIFENSLWVYPFLEFFFSDIALKEDVSFDTKLTDEARIKFIRQKMEDDIGQETFTLELKNKNNEVAYLGGWVESQGMIGFSWTFHGCYKSPEDFEADIQVDKFLCKGHELHLLSDDELLSLWDKRANKN